MRFTAIFNSLKLLSSTSVYHRKTVPVFNRNFHLSSAIMVKAKKFVYVKRFEGEPKLTDFELVEEDLPALQNGGKFGLH